MVSHPVRPQPERQRRRRWPWIVGGSVVVLIGLGQLSDSDDADEYGARDVCRQAVADRLVSPGSADFSSPDVNELAGPDVAYRVVGHVDSGNRAGASIRIDYECKVQHVSGTEWEIIDLQHSER